MSHQDNTTDRTDFDPSMFDAYAPAKIAERIETVGVAKAKMPFIETLALAVLAGAFISFGAVFYTLVGTGNELGFGLSRLVGGLVFCLGLILVVVGGAELFTGNVLMVMGWAHGKVKRKEVFRNWAIVYVGNFLGSLVLVGMVYGAGVQDFADGGVGKTMVKIAEGKVALSFDVAFIRGVLCNALVCLAIWLCFAARSVTDKILAIIFPITAFVALGFEHSIANMFFIPMGILVSQGAQMGAENLNLAGLSANLIPVTLGNIVGGGLFVALSYYVIYLHGKK
jgi:formate transporter